MNVAVIGGTGLVGRRVVAALEAAGSHALVIARHPPRVAVREFRRVDLTVVASLEGAFEGCDAVVSAAGGVRQSSDQSFHDIHVRGARNLVDACRTQRVRRVVHLSSLGARPSSRSAFHRSKYLGEDLVRRSLLDVTVLRPSAIYGAGDDFLGPLARLLKRLPIAPLPGRGNARFQPIAADDVARAVVNALERPASVGQAFDLPGPEVLTIAQVYDRVLEALGLRRFKLGVPYLFIEPMTHFFGSDPVANFSFDQLAILEEQQPGDPAAAAKALGIDPAPLTVAAIRRLLPAP